MAITSPGTWGINGFNIPDLGLTELFATPSATPTTFYNPQADPKATGAPSSTAASSRTAAYANATPNTPTSSGQAAYYGTPSNPGPGAAPDVNTYDPNNLSGWGKNFGNDRAAYEAYGRQMEYQNSEVGKRENQVRSDINSGFDSYFSELDKIMGNIPGQQKGQEQIVDNNYNQGVTDLGLQKDQSQVDLNASRRKNDAQQVKSLQDIADNIKNLFRTGNIMLGAKGAGDSSAANQYSYAATKLGSKQRGDVMTQTRAIESEIADRESKLNNIVTQETGKLKTERDNKVIQIAQYFQDAQNQLLQAKANGQLQKGQSLAQLSTQLLQAAQQKLMQEDANFKNQQNALLSWATSNATTIGQLKTNLASVGQYNVPGVQVAQPGQPTFDAQNNLTQSFGGGGTVASNKTPETLNMFGGLLNG